MGDIIGGWRMECGCVHNLLTIQAGSHHSRLCPMHAAAPALLNALRPLAALYRPRMDPMPDDRPIYGNDSGEITVGDIRAARAALRAAEETRP